MGSEHLYDLNGRRNRRGKKKEIGITSASDSCFTTSSTYLLIIAAPGMNDAGEEVTAVYFSPGLN